MERFAALLIFFEKKTSQFNDGLGFSYHNLSGINPQLD